MGARPCGRLELDLNDLYEDYTDTMGRLQKEAGNSVSGLVWDGESQELIKQEINRYADAANKLASDYYSSVRDLWAQYGETDMPEYNPPTINADRAVWQMEGGFNNTDFMGLRYKDVIPDENGIVHNRAGKSIDELWPTFTDEEQAFGYVQNLMQTVGRLTMQRAVANDPTKPRWARVPRGAKTCAFCLMLASRGFAYLSEDAAGRQMQYHADCDCDIVPSWGSATLKDYDPDKYCEMYQAAEAAAGENGDWHDALAQLRRIYHDDVKDGVLETSKPWPDDVIQISGKVWSHIFDGHGPSTRIPKKTHFPDEWSEEEVKWAVRETICNPDEEPSTSPDGVLQRRHKEYKGEIIEVYLKIRRNTHGKFAVQSAYPITGQERSRRGI
ncbi:EndoU domain-containing protein [Bifidobacterium dentium]|nr:EndoU domain-containing protein [Bifidobacterium dentium]MBF9695963.1 EndoU domain-containing protein [Bifidobacterium dentium]MBF9712121.1 EndoU domain-containing protein [Bifidobacterium dentium]MBF9714083.1 EndoU domain-containing protein [Bifidobacterium dentium]MBF9718056.1 EndoU domain-containing protein [Bifidobacterium dentium]